MRRKIIELGHDCMVLSLPRKWILQNNLKKSDELTVEIDDNKLIVTTDAKISLKDISLDIKETTESGIRTLIINAYRAGYDKILIKYSGEKEIISKILDNYMLGFELFSFGNESYILESVAEPSIEDFDKILIKELQIPVEMIKNIDTNIEQDFFRIRKYDNFLKRILTKHNMYPKLKGFIWQFLSTITHIARECVNLNKTAKKYSKEETDFLKHIEEMLHLLQKGFQAKDINSLIELHSIEKKMTMNEGLKLLKSKNPLVGYYLMSIARQTYLATSPLTGFIQTQTL